MDRSRSLSHRFPATALAIALFALFALVLGTAACDSGTQEPDAPEASTEFGAAPPPTPTPEDAVPEPRGDGSIAAERFPTDLPEGLTAEIPENFPSNIPIYPGAQPALGKGADLEGAIVSGLQLLSNDAPSEIFDFYETGLTENGWEITDSKSDATSNMINATHGNCKAVLFIQGLPQGGSDIFLVNEC